MSLLVQTRTSGRIRAKSIHPPGPSAKQTFGCLEEATSGVLQSPEDFGVRAVECQPSVLFLDNLAMDGAAVWNSSWAWSILLMVSTVIIHVIGLGLFNVKIVQVLTVARGRPRFIYAFALGIGGTAIWAICLHSIEAGIWAAAYRLLGALPDGETAMLYSLSAITTYGHSQLFLTDRWRLMGALEALNGVILIGLTTALMYGLIQRVWPVENRALPHMPWPRGEDAAR